MAQHKAISHLHIITLGNKRKEQGTKSKKKTEWAFKNRKYLGTSKAKEMISNNQKN